MAQPEPGEASGGRAPAFRRLLSTALGPLLAVLVSVSLLGAAEGCATLSSDDLDGAAGGEGGTRPDGGPDRHPANPCAGHGDASDVDDGPSPLFCSDDVTVSSCSGGHPVQMQMCPPGQACRDGACTPASCARAMDQQSSVGCRFYTVHADGVPSDRAQARTTVLVVGNPQEAVEAHVQVSTRLRAGEVGDWTMVASATVPPGSSTRLRLDLPATHALGIVAGAGLRVDSDQAVSVFQLQDDDDDNRAATARGSTLLPAHALGSSYRALAFAQAADSRVTTLDPDGRGAGFLVMVGVRDGTVVTVTLPAAVPVDVGSEASTVISFPVSLDEGDVFQLTTAAEGADLSTAAIASTAPIAMYAGNFATDYGTRDDETAAVFADGAYEAMWPTDRWAGDWLVPRLAPAADAGCDSLFTSSGPVPLRVMVMTADQAATVVFHDAKGGSLTAVPQDVPVGSVRVFDLPGPTDDTLDVIEVAALPGQRIWVAQALDCAPSLVPGIPLGGSFSRYVLGFPMGFASRVAVVHDPSRPVLLDGRVVTPVGTATFARPSSAQPFPVGLSVFSESDLGSCQSGVTSGCTHLLTGDFYGVSWRGQEATTSYGTTAPIFSCHGPGVVESCL